MFILNVGPLPKNNLTIHKIPPTARTCAVSVTQRGDRAVCPGCR